MNGSDSGKINLEEVKHWIKWSVIFASPAIIAFLTALQTQDFSFALGAGYSALLSSLIGLVKTISQDNR
jgi:hypothetical protein